MSEDPFTLIDRLWRSGLAPEPQLQVSEWADAHRMLPATAAEPGRWRTSRTPYLREIMDCLSVSSPIERVVFQKSAQVGATECGLNWLAYTIASAPGLGLYVLPTTDAAHRTVRTRVDPLIESTPALAERVVKARSRDPGNTVSLKTFPAGQWAFVGANSGVGLRSTPARYLFCDEIDSYPHDVDKEGDPVGLAIARTISFRGRRKIFLVSTPTVEGASRIATAFAESDQRRYFVGCPVCGVLQVLSWSGIRWPEGRRDLAAYVCADAECGAWIEERHKAAMLAEGVWRPTAPGDGKTAGFHISALYSPFASWGEIAIEHGAVYRDPSRLQVWVNTSLGEPFEDRTSQGVTPAALMARAETWPPEGPKGLAVAVAGIDVQLTRIEIEIVAWGVGEESWSLDYITLAGSPLDPETWRRLDEVLLDRYAGLPVAAACIDSGGHWSKQVYDFCTPRHGRRVYAIKGSARRGLMVWPRRPSRPKPGRPPLYIIGSDSAREVCFARLAIEEPGPGCCHFPRERDLGFFEMLCAERPVRRFVRGVARREWVKASHARNEAMDARCYALAALHALKSSGLNLEREAARVERLRAVHSADASAGPMPVAATSRRAGTVIRSSWVDQR